MKQTKRLFLLALIPLVFWGCQNKPQDRGAIPIVDCHVHLWDLTLPNPHDARWPRKRNGDLYRNILPDYHMPIVKANGVTATILVLSGQELADNQWNLEVSEPHKDFYRGVVGNMSRAIGTDEFEPLFEKLCKDERYVGYRLSSYAKEPINDSIIEHLRLTAEKGKTVDFLLTQYTLDDVAEIARKVPNLKIIVDHFGTVWLDEKPLPAEWKEAYRKLASYPNVYCKVSAMFGRFKKQPAPKDISAYKEILDLTMEVFGEDRIIYGSDWPVTQSTGDYAAVLKITRDYFNSTSRSVQEKLFYKNAVKFYGIKWDYKKECD